MKIRPLSIGTRLALWYSGLLLAILILMSALSYSLLHRSVMRDVDASLVTLAHVIRDAGDSTPGVETETATEEAMREILGPAFYDKFFRLMDRHGNPELRSRHLPGQWLPLSALARNNATQGERTFETVRLISGERVRLLTMPITRRGQITQLVQVGIPLERAEQTLDRYLGILLVLVPVGLGLAAVGGVLVARSALRPVDVMSRTARRITGEDLEQRLALRGTGDELDRLAETLNEMLARLETAFAEMRRFTADAAHELRTPLTALKGGIQVALRSERTPDEYRRVLASSLEEVDRLARLAEDLLALSRASADAAARRERVELEPLVVEAFDVGARLGHDAGVAVRLGDVATAHVIGDAASLRRAILNVVDNAAKYTAAGGKVEVALTTEGHDAIVSVTDTGAGIDPADTERIFQPFVRVDAARARDTGGAGLGLAIARSIVVAHGGSIGVSSRPGAGSTFTIRLPLA